MRRSDVLVTGPLVSCDYILAEHLCRAGLDAIAVRKSGAEAAISVPASYLGCLSADRRVAVEGPLEFLGYARNSRLIVSITGTLTGHLRQLWPLRRILGLPPVINLTTGSDITEHAVGSSLSSRIYRQYLRFVDLNWVLPMPHALQNLVRLDVPNVVFMKGFPYMVPEPDQALPPLAPLRPDAPLRLLHCSNLDWNVTDFGAERNSTKGNDKFLHAFIAAVRQGHDLQLSILERGPDQAIAKEILARGGASDRVTWKGHLSRDDLYREISKAHIVVNMFAHGGAGGISYEALAVGRPVMQYANPTYFSLMYGGEMPPFISGYSSDEILSRLIWCRTEADLPAIAKRGRDWVRRHIAPPDALTDFLFYYSHLTGDRRLDFGLHIESMAAHVRSVQAGSYDPFA